MLGRKDSYLGWWASPHCEAYRWEMISGKKVDPEPSVPHWYKYLESAVFGQTSPGKWLSICCGRGELERFFAREGKFTSCLAADVSEAQLRIARRAANKIGIKNVTYLQKDLNDAEFLEDEFDLVIAQGGIHHIKRLDNLFREINRALKPGGFFAMHEYVGPIRWELGALEISQINRAMEMIPDAFRPSLNANQYWCLQAYDMRFDPMVRRITKAAYYQAMMLQDRWRGADRRLNRTYRSYVPEYSQSYLRNDPSESVSGENILPTLEEYFDIIDVRSIGGTIISWIHDFDWGFDLTDPGFLEVVRSLISFERDLIVRGVLPSHYASIVVKNRKE